MSNANSGAYTLRRLCQEEWPITNLTETGNRIGVTKERVRQLVRKHHIPTYLRTERPPAHVCSWCGKPTSGKRQFCRRCWEWSHYSILRCEACGAYFARQNSQIRTALKDGSRYRGHFFCCMPCFYKARQGHKAWAPFWEFNRNWKVGQCPGAPDKRHHYVCRHCGRER